MNQEERARFLGKLQEFAEKKGIPVKELPEKVELGVLGLRFWGEAGETKLPEEFLRSDLAELVKEIQQLWENLQ